MTIEKFQGIVLRLSNQMPVRYYLHSYGEETMAIQFFRANEEESYGRLLQELADLGFRKIHAAPLWQMWAIEKT